MTNPEEDHPFPFPAWSDREPLERKPRSRYSSCLVGGVIMAVVLVGAVFAFFVLVFASLSNYSDPALNSGGYERSDSPSTETTLPPDRDCAATKGGAAPPAVGAELLLCDLANVNLDGGQLVSANLYFANLANASLTAANLTGANLTDADLTGANLTDADLTGAILQYANLTGANLQRTNLTRGDLSYANLSGANLQDANLTGGVLPGADLRGANLTGANLNYLSLRFVNLTGADLTGADLTGVTWVNTTCPDGTNSDTHADTCVGYGI